MARVHLIGIEEDESIELVDDGLGGKVPIRPRARRYEIDIEERPAPGWRAKTRFVHTADGDLVRADHAVTFLAKRSEPQPPGGYARFEQGQGPASWTTQYGHVISALVKEPDAQLIAPWVTPGMRQDVKDVRRDPGTKPRPHRRHGSRKASLESLAVFAARYLELSRDEKKAPVKRLAGELSLTIGRIRTIRQEAIDRGVLKRAPNQGKAGGSLTETGEQAYRRAKARGITLAGARADLAEPKMRA